MACMACKHGMQAWHAWHACHTGRSVRGAGRGGGAVYLRRASGGLRHLGIPRSHLSCFRPPSPHPFGSVCCVSGWRACARSSAAASTHASVSSCAHTLPSVSLAPSQWLSGDPALTGYGCVGHRLTLVCSRVRVICSGGFGTQWWARQTSRQVPMCVCVCACVCVWVWVCVCVSPCVRVPVRIHV